jgi:hypothetical protein
MEIAEIGRNLLGRKLAVAFVCGLALLAALYAGYHVGPSGVSKRGRTFGAAQTQVLVDSPKSALANLKQDTIPLTTRAGVFAQLMASSSVRAEIARISGIPAREITARGPFDDPAAAPSDAAVARAPKLPSETAAAGRHYRLTFVAQQDLPLVTVYAEAPDSARASRLANAVTPAVRAHIARLHEQGDLPATRRVVIRSLGAAEGGTVNTGTSKMTMLLAFLAILVLGSVGILLAGRAQQAASDPVGPTGRRLESIATPQAFVYPAGADVGERPAMPTSRRRSRAVRRAGG